MTLRLKLSLSFLLVSLLTAGAVGVTAWLMLARDFRSAAREQSFQRFQEDLQAYLHTYGSWENGVRNEPLPVFINRTRFAAAGERPPPPPRWEERPPPGERPPPLPRPPFRFLLMTPDRLPVSGPDSLPRDQPVPDELFASAKPVVFNGQIVLYASPQGETDLSPQDEAYLQLMRKALFVGLGGGTLVALLLGLLFGNRLVARVHELVRAMDAMRPGGDGPTPVAVHSNDEIGQLAATFNRMSGELHLVQCELRESNQTIQAQAEQLREQSHRDALTGLHNRRHFDEQVGRLFQLSRRHQRPLCVMLADLDHFKSINDQFSHAVGDAVLKATAQLFAAHLRETDLLARYGGEEFVAVLVESTLEQASQRCEALRQRIAAADWAAIDPQLRVTVSIGLCDDLSLASPAELLAEADRQLYRAKAAGRNRVEPAATQNPAVNALNGSDFSLAGATAAN